METLVNFIYAVTGIFFVGAFLAGLGLVVKQRLVSLCRNLNAHSKGRRAGGTRPPKGCGGGV